MRAFRAEPDGSVSAELDPEEATILAQLAAQLTELLGTRSASETDAALRRLLPDAYPDDAEASAEFRRFTVDGLVERKLANASAVIASLRDVAPKDAATVARATELRLDPATAQAWLRSLNDLRLTIGTRLGIQQDGDGGSDEDGGADVDGSDRLLRELYHWLGFVQQSLVEALDGA
ncbi:MAG: DUF2017 domain-containing protein [Lacisediminihabitans sp.]